MPKFSFLVVGSLALLASAVLLLKAALAKAPNNADAWNLMGYADHKLGQVDQALGFTRRPCRSMRSTAAPLNTWVSFTFRPGARNRPRKC